VYLSTLAEWLSWVTSIHPQEIALGLERVQEVAKRMQVLSFDCPVVIVGGTNGKGSTVAGIEAIYRATGRHVGAFTSPILFKHNEQVRIDGENPSDEVFCDAFAQVEAQRGDISLTPFEFHTLAALWIFKSRKLDVLILEVGLGGRLDAVNIIDADVSVVTSISIDHVDYLGPTREHIGYEKAGIFRKDRPAVCGDLKPPVSLVTEAEKKGALFFCQGRDFNYEEHAKDWSWHTKDSSYTQLPLTTLALQNMSTVLMVVTLLQSVLPVTKTAITEGLQKVRLMGRQQIFRDTVTEIYDVSHNLDSVRMLAERLKKISCFGKTYAAFSMLADKDIAGVIAKIKDQISEWHVAPLAAKRGASSDILHEKFAAAKIKQVVFYKSIQEAYLTIKEIAKPGDRIVIFGSFHTVADVASVSGKFDYT